MQRLKLQKNLDAYKSLLTTSPIRSKRNYCSENRELYEDNAIARKIVDLIIDKALLGLDTLKANLDLVRLILTQARIDKNVICLRDDKNQIRITDDQICTINLEDNIALYNDTQFYDFYYIKDGTLSRCVSDIQKYEKAKEAISTALNENHLFVIGVKGLAELSSVENGGLYKQRLQSIQDSKDEHKGVAIDSEIEEIDFKSVNLSNLKDLYEVAERSIIASSGLPKSYLFGSAESNALSSAGSTDENSLLDTVLTYRRLIVAPLCDWLKIEYEISYKSFLELDAKEIAETDLLNTNRVVSLLQASLISQQTAQSMLGLPIEKIELPTQKTNNNTIGNTFTSDLIDKKI